MTAHWITADRIFDGDSFRQDHALHLQHGTVRAVSPLADIPDGADVQHLGAILTSGFFDIQVNGGGGALLNTDPTPDALCTIAASHRRFGTTSILPTVITDAPEVLEAAVDALLSLGRPAHGIRGLHIEGPHLSQGRRGTHATEFVRPLDSNTLHQARRLRDAGWPVLITVAPEVVSASDIADLAAMGVVVSLGHSEADFDQANAALDAGATCFTHLFNAMPAMGNRQPGIVGAAIASRAWCGIIADGVHVHPAMIALACRGRPVPDRMIAVSDAMATVGGPEAFQLYGQTIRRNGNRLVNAEGSLAGAHVTLGEALQNLVAYGVSPRDALRMCIHNPSELMGLSGIGALVGLRVDDVLVLDSAYQVVSVGVSGIESTA